MVISCPDFPNIHVSHFPPLQHRAVVSVFRSFHPCISVLLYPFPLFRVSHFQRHQFCTAQLHFEGDLTGYYVYGSKRLVLTPVRREHHMVVTFACDFNHGDDKRTDCEIIYEASHFKCADVHLHLQVTNTQPSSAIVIFYRHLLHSDIIIIIIIYSLQSCTNVVKIDCQVTRSNVP